MLLPAELLLWILKKHFLRVLVCARALLRPRMWYKQNQCSIAGIHTVMKAGSNPAMQTEDSLDVTAHHRFPEDPLAGKALSRGSIPSVAESLWGPQAQCC